MQKLLVTTNSDHALRQVGDRNSSDTFHIPVLPYKD